jgi:glutaredoxin/glutathione-dependent peroxiredoxin
MTVAIGDALPKATFRLVEAEGTRDVSVDEFFAGRKIVLFGLPGAFTPTCHKNHLPGFLANAEAFKAKGVTQIAVTAVNDPHVMRAWAKATGAEGHISFLSDGNAEFATAAGLSQDFAAGFMGVRSRRYAMLVEDGKITRLNVEEAAGKAEVSSAETLLSQI